MFNSIWTWSCSCSWWYGECSSKQMVDIIFIKILNTILKFRPMVVLAGSSDQPLDSMGAFQEFPQVYNYIR